LLVIQALKQQQRLYEERGRGKNKRLEKILKSLEKKL
jgi:hypothetical protein